MPDREVSAIWPFRDEHKAGSAEFPAPTGITAVAAFHRERLDRIAQDLFVTTATVSLK